MAACLRHPDAGIEWGVAGMAAKIPALLCLLKIVITALGRKMVAGGWKQASFVMLGSLSIGMNVSCPLVSTLFLTGHEVTYLKESSPGRPGVEEKAFPKFHRFER